MNGSGTKLIQSIQFSDTVLKNILVRISSFSFQITFNFLFYLTKYRMMIIQAQF